MMETLLRMTSELFGLEPNSAANKVVTVVFVILMLAGIYVLLGMPFYPA